MAYGYGGRVMSEPQFVLLIGNVIDGHVPVGPFTSKQDAIDWGERHHAETEWVATLLVPPDGIIPVRTHHAQSASH
jgi:hypothetical protein